MLNVVHKLIRIECPSCKKRQLRITKLNQKTGICAVCNKPMRLEKAGVLLKSSNQLELRSYYLHYAKEYVR